MDVLLRLEEKDLKHQKLLFQPSLISVEGAGVAELLFNIIHAAGIDTRSEFYKHIELFWRFYHVSWPAIKVGMRA